MMTDTPETAPGTFELGRDADGAHILARVKLDTVAGHFPYACPDTVETVAHDHVRPADIPTVSVTYERWPKGHRPGAAGRRGEPDSLGASRDAFRDVVRFVYGWDADRCRELADLGDRWHLNGMRAACAHQSVVWEDSDYGRRPSLTLTEPCSLSGYRYGSAWLADPMPADVLSYFRAVAETGRPPAWHVELDGVGVAGPFTSHADGWRWILRHQGQSVDYATTHGGYAIVARPVSGITTG